MVVEAKKLRVGMNYCLFGNVISHLWLTHARSHLQSCRIAAGNLPDCIWKPVGLHMEASWIAFASWIVFAMFKR